MTRLIIPIVAAFALPFAAVPAFAQYGGTPDDPQAELGDAGGKAIGPGGAAQAPNGKEDPADVDEDNDREDGAYDNADPDPDEDADLNAPPAGPMPEAVAPADEGEAYTGETWQDSDGRVHCRRSDGTTGLIVGGGAGALVGRGIDRHGERATGTIIGAVAGALVGRAVEQSARCQAETRNR